MPAAKTSRRKPRSRPSVSIDNGTLANSTLGVVGVYTIQDNPLTGNMQAIVIFDRPLQNLSYDESPLTVINDADDEFEPSQFNPFGTSSFTAYVITFEYAVTGFVKALRVTGPANGLLGIDGSTLPEGLDLPITDRDQ